MTPVLRLRYQLWGWILFVFSALFFIATSLRAGDLLGLGGGLLFLLACFVFLVPLVHELRAASNSSPRHRCSRYRRDWFRAARWLWHAPGAPRTPPAPLPDPDRNPRLAARSALRFYASTR